MELHQKPLSGRPPPLPVDPSTGEPDESEVPLDEIQSQFFLLREDGGVGCRFCFAFHTKEQNRPLYPLRDHVHSIHYNIFPYRCSDCGFKTSSYRLSFSHAEATSHRRAIVERKSKEYSKCNPATSTNQITNNPAKKRRKSNPLGSANMTQGADEILFEELPASEDCAAEDDSDASKQKTGGGDTPAAAYVVPSFLPTPPLTLRIQREFFRYDIEGYLQCSKCEFRVQSASNDGPGAKKALLEHVYTTHIENLPWTCKDCQFTTKFKSNLTRHCRKLKHEMNAERHAPPGVQEPDARVVAASAKRVKWVGVNLTKELQLSLNQECESAKDEHGYSLPKITPALRLSWQLQTEDGDDSCHRLGHSNETDSSEGNQDTVRLKWTGQSVEPVTISSSATTPRKRKQTPRILPDVKQYEVESQMNPEPRNRRTSTSKRTAAAAAADSETVVSSEALPDSRLSPEALREKYVLPMENNVGVRCAICDFVIRKTPRVSDPLTIMLSHVCGHLALVLRVTCVACGFMTDNAANWEAHRTESELEGGPLATHEPTFAIAADTK